MTVDVGQRAALAAEVFGPLWGELVEVVAGRPGWMLDAACRDATENFFADRGEPTEPAKRLCADCPVQPECLDYALSDTTLAGIWGGVGERARQKIRRERRAEPIAV